MYNPFASKTNWLQIVIILVAVINAVIPFLSPDLQAAATTVLAVLAIFTHTSTAVKAGAVN